MISFLRIRAGRSCRTCRAEPFGSGQTLMTIASRGIPPKGEGRRESLDRGTGGYPSVKTPFFTVEWAETQANVYLPGFVKVATIVAS